MPFSDILGQEKARSFLRQVITREKMPHAYLFTGIPGVGKKSTAQALAMALNCLSPRDGDACGSCASCRKIQEGNAPDFQVIYPERGSIGIDQIRELNHGLAFSPLAAQFRVLVICKSEAMTPEAANAFLKTLEEPPLGNILILTATEPLDLLPTIVSRCQKVSFQPLPRAVVARWINEKKELSRKESEIIAALSGGSIGRAAEMVESRFLEQREEWLVRITELPALPKPSSLVAAYTWAEELRAGGSRGGEETLLRPADVLDIWKSWYRDLLLAKVGSGEHSLLNMDFAQNLKKIAKGFSIKNLVKSFFLIDRASRHLEENRNTALVLEHLVLQLRTLTGSPKGGL